MRNPWTWTPFNGDFVCCSLDSREKSLLFHHATWEIPKDVRNLIAAAPELLEALNRILPHALAARYEVHPDIVFAANAIAKAEGK